MFSGSYFEIAYVTKKVSRSQNDRFIEPEILPAVFYLGLI
jgi:hypothetical protein